MHDVGPHAVPPHSQIPLAPEARGASAELRTCSLSVGAATLTLVHLEQVSAQSCEALAQLVRELRPKAIALELDPERAQWMQGRAQREHLTLRELVRQGRMPLFSAHLSARILQRKLGYVTDVEPAQEMIAALEVAQSLGIGVVFGDRPVTLSALRAWRRTPFWGRVRLGWWLTVGTMGRTSGPGQSHGAGELGERLEALRGRFPHAAEVLLDEGAQILALRLRAAALEHGEVLALVSPMLAPGVREALEAMAAQEAEEGLEAPGEVPQALLQVPGKSAVAEALPWLISLVILGLFVAGFVFGDVERFKDAALAWIVWHSLLAGLATVACLGHPLTVLAVALCSPVVSLNPAIGAGMVGAAVQMYVAPPSVGEMESVGEDIVRLSGWWTNRLARVALILVAGNAGSSLGSVVALKWLAPG